ncbi:hypothetical protein [uncultured Helicobacter sp.]|uniref:hypothetical protein n=1 Tax=uncultured Helicobacter sp. TaxID=175537 RepID=UPI003753C914
MDSEFESKLLKLDSKPTLDSECALDSVLGLLSWRGVDCVGSPLQAKNQSLRRGLWSFGECSGRS